jgi:hypothetical protein
VYFSDFADGGPQAERILVGHHGGSVRPVMLEDALDNVVPLVPRKIDVDVRRIVPAWVQKSFKEELMADRTHMSDL